MKEASFDHETQQYYRDNAKALAQRYARARGGIEFWFDAAFPKGSKILDVGAAAGRDVLLLLEAGYDACGVDPCRELVAEGLKKNPVLKDHLACDSLPGLETIGDHGFDGILCSAVLMHLPEETLFDAAFGLRRVLKPGGRLLVSLPVDAGGEPVRGRDETGRLFNGLSPDRLEASAGEKILIPSAARKENGSCNFSSWKPTAGSAASTGSNRSSTVTAR